MLKYILIILSVLNSAGCSTSQKSEQYLTDKFWKDALTLPGWMAKDTKDTISKKDNQIILLMAGGASVVMNQGLDRDIAKHQDKDIFHNIADRSLNLFGGPEFQYAAAGFWYMSNLNSGDEANRNKAAVLIRALSITDLTTMALKVARDNRTPEGDKWGWPSGHTSSSFAAASVFDELYGPKVGIAAYTVASLVALRQLDQCDHWASDIVFGAALGWTIGHTVAGNKDLPEVAGFKVVPSLIGRQASAGISLLKFF